MNLSQSFEYDKLLSLSYKASNKTATPAERDELMLLLLEEGEITDSQYREYKSGQGADFLLSFGVGMATVLLLGQTLRELTDAK